MSGSAISGGNAATDDGVIKTIYAWIGSDNQGRDGVCFHALPSQDDKVVLVPLIGVDMNRANNLREFAENVARISGNEVRLVMFSTTETLETITPPLP